MTLQTHYSFDRYPVLVYFVAPYTGVRCVGVPGARKVTEFSPTGQSRRQLTSAAGIKTFLKPTAFMLISLCVTTTKQQNNSGHIATPKPWLWPDTLDALTAAPEHHWLVFENERVRVLKVRIGPGEIVPLHTHR
jgi:hypothetical protein